MKCVVSVSERQESAVGCVEAGAAHTVAGEGNVRSSVAQGRRGDSGRGHIHDNSPPPPTLHHAAPGVHLP